MTKAEILEKIDTLYVSMVNYHAKLNSDYSIGLFLVTLGCYSNSICIKNIALK